VRVSPQYAQAFQTPTWADAAPQLTIVAAPAHSSLQVMRVAGFTAERSPSIHRHPFAAHHAQDIRLAVAIENECGD